MRGMLVAVEPGERMKTEHLQNVRAAHVAGAWLFAIAITSLVAFALVSAGVMAPESTAPNVIGTVISVAAGFFAGGLFVGIRAVEAPILHALAVGLTSLVVWFLVNVIAAMFVPTANWAALTPALAIGMLFTQWVACTVGALIGHNIAVRGEPGLAEQDAPF
jgi:hypothetical protein